MTRYVLKQLVVGSIIKVPTAIAAKGRTLDDLLVKLNNGLISNESFRRSWANKPGYKVPSYAPLEAWGIEEVIEPDENAWGLVSL